MLLKKDIKLGSGIRVKMEIKMNTIQYNEATLISKLIFLTAVTRLLPFGMPSYI